MMLQTINYFFIPALAVLLHERKENPALRPSLRLLAVYMSYTAALVPCTRVMTSIICRVFRIDIAPDTPEYTLLALLAAVVLPEALRLVRGRVTLRLVERGGEHG